VNKAKKNSQTKVIAAIAAGLLVFAAGGWFALVGPKKQAVSAKNKEIVALQQKIAVDQAAAAAAKSDKPVQVADIFRLTKAMPDTPDMADIVLELSQVAREAGIHFQSISPGGAVFQTGYEVLPIDLEFQGNFYDLADFIYRLRNLVGVYNGKLDATGRLFTVDKLSFGEGDAKFPSLAASLTVDAYVYGVTDPNAVATTSTDTTSTSTDTTSTTTTATTTTTPTPATPPTGASAAGASTGMTG
jgi:Tfp pilus assembly protein PilO